MNTQEQRFALGTFAGWKLHLRIKHNGMWHDIPTWYEPCFGDYLADSPPAGQMLGAYPPNYPGDLNAVHKIEELLDEEQWRDYIAVLSIQCGQRYAKTKNRLDYYNIHANASHKTEALLRTLKLWKD